MRRESSVNPVNCATCLSEHSTVSAPSSTPGATSSNMHKQTEGRALECGREKRGGRRSRRRELPAEMEQVTFQVCIVR